MECFLSLVTLDWLCNLGRAFFLADRFTRKQLPDRDPFLLPLASLLSGWGLLTIWRLNSAFGIRQAIWLTISVIILISIFYLPSDLSILRRYKYILLTSGLVLDRIYAFTWHKPGRLRSHAVWLGCCGVYLQPSEPLKLLLVVYLSAYLSDRLTHPLAILPFTPSYSICHGLGASTITGSTRLRHRIHIHFDLHRHSLPGNRQAPSI